VKLSSLELRVMQVDIDQFEGVHIGTIVIAVSENGASKS
jgi:hypothetical protein